MTETLGDALAARRKVLNHSQDQAATALGTSQTNISRWEMGTPALGGTRELYEKLADYLKVTIETVGALILNSQIAQNEEAARRKERRR